MRLLRYSFSIGELLQLLATFSITRRLIKFVLNSRDDF